MSVPLELQDNVASFVERDRTQFAKVLVARGHLTEDQASEVIRLSKNWGVSLTDVLMARKWMSQDALFGELAAHHRLDFVDLNTTSPDAALLESTGDSRAMAHFQTVPIAMDGDVTVLATAQPGPRVRRHVQKTYGLKTRFVVTTPAHITRVLQKQFRDAHSHRAVYALAELDPEMSAQQVFTPIQVVLIYLAASVFLFGLILAPISTLIAVNIALTILYLGNFLFKGFLVWVGGEAQDRSAETISLEVDNLQDVDLPVYTVLVPMFKEPEVLPILANALRQLDYPLAKLDIKIVLEETDNETIEAAEALNLEGIFEIIRVPESHPQTKPKACNYALNYARGDFLVIFDAEDKPEPDQLKKVIAAFKTSPENTACIQCRLNYYNARENWLTRMFTLDYSLWFDLMLPGLEKLGIPIPLGGTSNHFRLDVLKELHAWDPFNVTEDADLGIRLTQKGYRVGVIESTTFEEANVSIPNWIRQRSRWVKGYMQTFLVHTRRPIHLYQTIGPAGVLGFVAFIGGTFLTGLLNPISWSVTLIWLMVGSDAILAYFPPIILYLSLANLLLGNGLLTYLTMIAPVRRRWSDLAPWGLTVIGYWVLMTIASYKALSQLIFNPFYWEKTQHGLSKHTAAEVADATISVQPEAA
ncbi:glycosyltransferase [Rhodobacteraceae bacterium]|nr:glycosyltransferase [Paracoccaceae bacterium]